MDDLNRRIELYGPWRESGARLAQRTVGREALFERIVSATEHHLQGRPRLPLFVFGPRGVGKSHLVALVRFLVMEGVRFVGEDVAAVRSADDLLDRIRSAGRGPSWLGERDTESPAEILVIEGFDRRLAELGTGERGRHERQKLRRALTTEPTPWLLATGLQIPTFLSDPREPFFGFFDAERVSPLDPRESELLLERVVPEAVRRSPHWPGRCRALCTLAAGSPRVLLSLAEACADDEDPEAASRALLEAVDRFTPHYQLRFRDLPPQPQRIVELLGQAPGELGPSEIARRLGLRDTTAATQCRRLADEGVLERRQDTHGSWYRLAEPLFRHWLELRTAPWEVTRVAVAASLLEALVPPPTLVDRFLDADPPGEVLTAAASRPLASEEAGRRLTKAVSAALAGGDDEALARAVARAVERGLAAVVPAVAVVRAGLEDRSRALALAGACRPLPATSTTLAWLSALHAGGSARTGFAVWVEGLGARLAEEPLRGLVALGLWALEQVPRGAPWVLRGEERARVAATPWLRVWALERGRGELDVPLLHPDDLGPLGAEDLDLDGLLEHASRVGDADLAARVSEAFDPVRPRRVLPANPRPALRAPRPDRLWAWMAATQAPLHVAATWAATLAGQPRSAVEGFAALPVKRPRSWSAAIGGLTALALADRDQLEALLVACPTLQPQGRQAAALATQLRADGGGRLHPELAALAGALDPITPSLTPLTR